MLTLIFPFFFYEHLNKKRGKLVLLPATDGCHVHKGSLPLTNRCHHLKNFRGSFPVQNPVIFHFLICWSDFLWANNIAAQEVSASKVKAWKDNWKSCLCRCFWATLPVFLIWMLFLFQVTETRSGPLGCSSYDNLDSVSSILLQSPESKLHLQGKQVLHVLETPITSLWKRWPLLEVYPSSASYPGPAALAGKPRLLCPQLLYPVFSGKRLTREASGRHPI